MHSASMYIFYKAAKTIVDKLGYKRIRHPQEKAKRYDHPEMAKVRDYVDTSSAVHGVHEQLICNLDQIWSMMFEMEEGHLYKDPAFVGQMADPLENSNTKKRVRQLMEEHLGKES